MTRPIAFVGDATTHGGSVISGSPSAAVNGKAIARVGDKVSCPKLYPNKKPHGVNAIVDGSSTCFIDGIAVALHGSATECGCTLIATGPASVG